MTSTPSSPHIFTIPTRVLHGPGSLSRLGEEAGRLNLARVLLVSDPGVRKAGLLGRAQQVLERASVVSVPYCEVEENPCMATVERGHGILVENQLNGVVVIGGGSAMCAAKGIALLGANGGKIADYEGVGKNKQPSLPLIAIPTTAGSGSEVSKNFILTNEVAERKFTVSAGFPYVAILDAEMLATLPPRAAVFAGLDALSHAIEALWARGATPLTDGLALASACQIQGNLRAASFTDDLAAKDAMIVASAGANMACGNAGLAIVHAMGRFIEARYHVAHGHVNGVLLPITMEFNRPACRRPFSAFVRGVLPGATGDDDDLADGAASMVGDLMQEVEFAQTFEIEATADELRRMAQDTVRYPMTALNPRPVNVEDAEAMLRKAFGVN